MANETKAKDSAIDPVLEKFTEPDVTKSVNDAQNAPMVIGRLTTLLILILLIIAAILTIKEKSIIDRTSSLIKKGLIAKKKVIVKSALYSWKKKDYQYGFDPRQRFGGPYNARVTRDDGSDFHFTVFSPNGKSTGYFTGRKKDGGVIEGSGWWQNNPRDGRDGRDGGDFYLKMDSRDPRLYEGECTDSDLPDGVYIKLRITD